MVTLVGIHREVSSGFSARIRPGASEMLQVVCCRVRPVAGTTDAKAAA